MRIELKKLSVGFDPIGAGSRPRGKESGDRRSHDKIPLGIVYLDGGKGRNLKPSGEGVARGVELGLLRPLAAEVSHLSTCQNRPQKGDEVGSYLSWAIG